MKSQRFTIAGDDDECLSETMKRAWREKYDGYAIDRRLNLTDPRNAHIKEMTRWRDNDVKGNRKRYYINQVRNKNASIMTIVKQSRLE